VEGISKRFGERRVLDGVDFLLQRGERIGLVGRNGAGKTTFLRVVTGEIEPDSGKRVIGANTKIAYYDQARAQLDPEATVFDSAAGGEQHVDLGGRVIALRDYLDDLLFPVPMQRMQVKALSGGERNRLLLARLFLEGANVLVLDEPTNDLDIVTLNVLEGLLLSFTGSVLLVTHDRYFLDKVATSILAFEGDGKVVRYPGNFDMYRRLRPPPPAQKDLPHPNPLPKGEGVRARKLGYKEQRELEGMEAAIHAAEAKKAELEARLSDAANASNAQKLTELSNALEAARLEVDRLYARWQELEQRKA
jgi:ABC transport system ATP-binding/permease protein